VRILELYTHGGCPSREFAVRSIQKAIGDYPDISFRIIDMLDCPDKAQAAGVRMSPTLVLDGKIISIGTPEEKRLREILEVRQERPAER